VEAKTATAPGLVPAANGEPGTVVNAPLPGSTANAETSLLRLLLTYKYLLSKYLSAIVLAIAVGPRSAATGGPTDSNAPLVASMENSEMLSAPEFATKKKSPTNTVPPIGKVALLTQATATLVTLAETVPEPP